MSDTADTLHPVVVLLRGINVGGHKKVPMADLRRIASELRIDQVATYIQSGNLIGLSPWPAPELEPHLESALSREFGFDVPVVARSVERWLALAMSCPFPDAQAERPKFVHLGVSKRGVADHAADALQPLCRDGERVRRVDDALWLDYANGVGRSKLTPKALDRAAGSTVTCRNWRSVERIAELARGLEAARP